MDFESPDVEREFPGLYASESGRRSEDSEFSDDSQKVSKKDLLIGKRKDKKDKKDRGYATLEGESSPEEDADIKSPSKSKKLKPFKFSSKKEKREKSRDKEVKDKDIEKVKDKKKSDDKEKEKKKDKIKLKLKDKKKSKQDDSFEIEDLPVFGVPLSVATERSKCHDGVDLPLVVRDCIDHVEQTGVTAENVYKISGIKSRVQQVKRMYNQREAVSLVDYDLPVATSLLKEFLRELPEPVFTTELLKDFEEAGAAQCVSTSAMERFLKALVKKLPSCNRTLLAWLVKHLDNIASHEKQNKMTVHCIAVTLCPVLQASERLITILVLNANAIFPDITLNKYVPPVRSADSLSVPDRVEAIEEELKKQESLLEMLHSEMNRGFVSKNREEQLWEVQRIITQLKRRLRSLEKVSGVAQKQSCDETDASAKTDTDELNLRLQSSTQNQAQPVQNSTQPGPTQARGFSPEQSPLLNNHRTVPDGAVSRDSDASVSKVDPPLTDVSFALKKHASTCLNLTPALNQHAPVNFVNDQHVIKHRLGNAVPLSQAECNGSGLRRQLSLRLEPSRSNRPDHPNSPLNRTPSFRNDISTYLSRQSRSWQDTARPLDVSVALNRHPLFNDHMDPPLVRRPSLRNNVSRGVVVTRQPSFKNDAIVEACRPEADSLVKVQSSIPRIRPPVTHSKQEGGDKVRVNEGSSLNFPKVPSPIQEARRQSATSSLKLQSELPWRNEPMSLPANINNFKPSESLEVEEINKPSILLIEKKQLAILETEELTNVIINLRALCQLESKEINRIRNKIVELGGDPDTYSNFLSDESDEEVVSLPLSYERNGIFEKRKELKWESKRLKHQRDVLLRSICAECEACISLRVQIKLLQMNKTNNQTQ